MGGAASRANEVRENRKRTSQQQLSHEAELTYVSTRPRHRHLIERVARLVMFQAIFAAYTSIQTYRH